MPDAYDAIQGGLQVAFDTLTGLTRDDTSITLVKQAADSRTFEEVLIISDGWFWKGATTKQNALVRIARDDQELTDAMAQATHIKLGEEVFVIVTTDIIPPSGFDVMWQIFVEQSPSRTQFKAIY